MHEHNDGRSFGRDGRVLARGGEMEKEIISMNVRLEGQVQGVGFRDFAVREATHRGLKGWVRNRSDGTVEMVAAGLRAASSMLSAAARPSSFTARPGSLRIAE